MRENLENLVCAPANPESILPAGVDSTVSVNPYTGESRETRKGTIAATLNNVALLNRLLTLETEESKKAVKEISATVADLIPSLNAIGMFDFFEPTYWIGIGEQPGRLLVISLFFKHYPEKYTHQLKEQLTIAITRTPNLATKLGI